MRPQLSLAAALALLSLSSSLTQAQTVLYGVQSVFIEGKGLYIHGGRDSDASNTDKAPDSGQTFVINFNSTWQAESPSIRPLTNQYPSGGIGSTLFNNKKNWFLKDTDAVHIFNIDAETWAQEKLDSNVNPRPALGAIAVPTANDYVYVINGYKSTTDVNSTAVMMRYNVQTQLAEPMHSAMTVHDGHSIVWSTQKNSAFIYGGDDSLDQSLVEFFPSNPLKVTSIQRSIIGDVPASRAGHCMVEAYGGKQFYVFGGVTKQGATADMYRIDVDTMKWTRLRTGPLAAARSYMACGVTNDMFVAWGGATWDGTNSRFQVVTTPLVVFNLRSGEWQSTFDPTPASNDTGPVAPPSNTPSPDPETPVAAIVGGAAGALLLVGAGVGFLVYRRKQTRRGLPFMKVGDDEGDDDHNKNENNHGVSKHGIHSSSSPAPAYKMSHLHGSTGHGSTEFDQQQQQYHQQHPYQEQQHHYQQEPLLDPFADGTAYNNKVEHGGASPFNSGGMNVPPAAATTTFSPQSFVPVGPFASVHDNDAVKVDVVDYVKPGLGAQRNPHVLGGYADMTSAIRNPQSQ